MSTEPEPEKPSSESAPQSNPSAPPGPPPEEAAPVESSLAKPGERKLIAGILAIALGALGVHKFYLGYQKEGIIMLAVSLAGWFLCGVPTSVVWIVGIIEGILYLTKPDAEFEQVYLKGRKPWF